MQTANVVTSLTEGNMDIIMYTRSARGLKLNADVWGLKRFAKHQ